MNQTSNVLFFSTIAGLAMIGGLLIVLRFKSFSKKYSTYLISFAAGVMIASAFLNILPESIALNKDAVFVALFGFLAFYLIEHFIMIHTCHEEGCKTHSMSTMSAFGIGFHSLIDGIAIGVGFEVSTEIGLVTTMAVLLHKLPEGINTTAIMLHSGMKKKKAILYSASVALATLAGAVISLLFSNIVTKEILGALLALAAGSFLYIGAADLLPETHERFNKMNAAVLFLGVLFIYGLGKIF